MSKKIEKWEFSGNLDDSNKGIKNYQKFQDTVNSVMCEFRECFGAEVIHKYPLLIDNAICGSGHTPIITPTLNKYLIIKLGVEDGKEIGKTVFQVAHELTHLVFYSYLGLDKDRADDYEEGLCSAMSLTLIFKLINGELAKYINILYNDEYIGYKSGVQIAVGHGFSIENLKNTIMEEIDKTIQQVKKP